MKKLLGLAILAGAATSGAAYAEPSFSGNVALTTDYMFRGISQTQHEPTVQGGFDYSNGIFYAGTWASGVDFGAVAPNIDIASLELDLYAGIKPTTGPVSWDIGVIGYFYPDSWDPPGTDVDYWEFKVAPSISPAEGLTLGAALYYSPEFTTSTDSALYYELNGSYAISDMFTVSGAVGHQTSDQTGYFVLEDFTSTDEYTTWNIGATLNVSGFGIDLRYYDTDEDITNFVGETVSDGTVVLALKRAL